MYETTILNALRAYRVHIQIKSGLCNAKSNNSVINKIMTYEEYIEKGNEVTSSWLKENHTVASKAIKHSHDSIHRNYIETDDEYKSIEHKELNILVSFFKDYYEKIGIDIQYMDIDL